MTKIDKFRSIFVSLATLMANGNATIQLNPLPSPPATLFALLVAMYCLSDLFTFLFRFFLFALLVAMDRCF